MIELSPPSPTRVEALLARGAVSSLTYDHAGASRTSPPPGWRVDHNRLRLGAGPDDFERARAALREWAMFETGWTRLEPRRAPIEVGGIVAVIARTLSLSTVNTCRILYTIDETTPVGGRRFGFAYGTLPHHMARGEERFLVEMDGTDGSVSFDVLAFSRPHHWLAWIAYPYLRLCQRRFARDAKAAMRQAMAERRPERRGAT